MPLVYLFPESVETSVTFMFIFFKEFIKKLEVLA